MAEAKVGILIEAEDRATQTINKVDGQLSGFSKTVKKNEDTIKSLAAASTIAFAAISAAALKSVSDYSQFNTSVSRAGANINATSEEMEQFQSVAIKASRDVGVGIQETSQVFEQLAGGVFGVNETIALTEPTLKLMKIGMLDAATAAQTLSDASVLYGKDIADADQVVNTLVKTTQSALVGGLDGLTQFFQEAGPTASRFGISLEDSAVAAALFGDAGFRGSQGGNKFANALNMLSSSFAKNIDVGGEAQRVINDLQKSLFDTAGNIKPPIEMFKVLRDRLEQVHDPVQKTIALNRLFGESGGALDAIVTNMGDDLDRYGDIIKDVNGVSDDFIKRLQDSENPAGNLMEELQRLSVVVGKALLPAVKAFADFITPILEKIGAWIEANPKLAAAIMIAVGVVAALTMAVTGLALAVTFFMAVAWPVVGIVALIVVGVLLVVAAFYALYKAVMLVVENWGMIVAFGKQVWDSFVAYITEKFNAFASFVVNIWEQVKAKFFEVGGILTTWWQTFWNGLTDFFSNWIYFWLGIIYTLFDIFIPHWQEQWDLVKQLFMIAWQGIIDFFNSAWVIIKGVVEILVNGIVSRITWLKDMIEGAMNIILSIWRTVWEAIKAVFEAYWGWLYKKLTTEIDEIIEKVQKFLSLLEKLKGMGGAFSSGFKSVTDAVSGFMGSMVDRGKKGTSVNDAVISPDGKIVSTHPDDYLIATKNPRSLGGGGVTVNINGGMYLDQNSARKIGDELLKVLDLQYKY